MKKYYIPLLLICCMLFSGCNKNSTATETTQSTSSKEFNDNVNKNCTYIAYRGKVIILDNKNNKAKLTNLTDVESSDKVINYSYENMCNLIDQLTVEKSILVDLIMFYMVFLMPTIQQIKTVKKMKIKKKIRILT